MLDGKHACFSSTCDIASLCAERAATVWTPHTWTGHTHGLGSFSTDSSLTPHLHYVQLEFYTLAYAESLGASQQTWPLAAEYLAWCPVHGRSSLVRLLDSLPLATSPERMAMKAIQVSPQRAKQG